MRAYEQRLQTAIERYEEQLDWYETHSTRDQNLFKGFQVLTLIFTALTPVLIAAGDVSPGIEAASSAVAAVCAGVLAVFNWRGNWVRFARTAEQLKSEKAYFDTRTSSAYAPTLTDEQALEAFMVRIESAALRETGDWGAELARAAQAASGDRPPATAPKM
jgi:Protein of unknown function (DUF4231)